jgi:hypothetical protein
VTIKDGALSARLDRGKEQRIDMTTPDGEYVTLEVRGSVSFDDIEFAVPRRTDTSFLYTFDRRETDWWREGGEWIDHGGFACVLASSWISLIAPKGRGYLWNKHLFASDIAVSFNVHENSEWFGWRARPQHVHYPYDNICVVLSPEENADRGYRLEVNADNRSRTVLYRNGTAVRTVSQKKGYPIRYVGGHAPYAPRNNRIGLIRRGATFIAVVNGVEVLRYEDAEPLPTSRVGIGGYRTRANFSHVEIRR